MAIGLGLVAPMADAEIDLLALISLGIRHLGVHDFLESLENRLERDPFDGSDDLGDRLHALLRRFSGTGDVPGVDAWRYGGQLFVVPQWLE